MLGNTVFLAGTVILELAGNRGNCRPGSFYAGNYKRERMRQERRGKRGKGYGLKCYNKVVTGVASEI